MNSTPARIERRDFVLDLLLSQRQRHGQDGAGFAIPHRHRGQRVLELAEPFVADMAALAFEADRACHLRRDTGGQQARGKQVTLAGGGQRVAHVDVHVLIDDAADGDHDFVGHRDHRIALVAPLLAHDGLDHPPRRRRGPHRARLKALAQLPGQVVSRHHGQRQHRHD
jgi:hypothetical protein